jgi:hypothetical protein
MNQKKLIKLFVYDKENGCLIWRHRSEYEFKNKCNYVSWNKNNAGKTAGYNCKGSKSSNTFYCRIQIKNKNYLAHRLIWLYVNGELPNSIDHINGNGIDNRIENLRNVDAFQNMKNCKISKTSKFGIYGVNLCKKTGNYYSTITNRKRRYWLGYSSDFFEACCKRKSAEIVHKFHSNHGRLRN